MESHLTWGIGPKLWTRQEFYTIKITLEKFLKLLIKYSIYGFAYEMVNVYLNVYRNVHLKMKKTIQILEHY